MTYVIPRPDWVGDALIERRGENAGFQMFSREGNDALAEVVLSVIEAARTNNLSRTLMLVALRQEIAGLSARFPEVYDTEPEWAVVNACTPFFDAQGWVPIERMDDL
jgi:hypothetical protein